NILRLQGIKYEYDIDKIKELNKSKQKGINTDSLNIHADSLDINCFNTKKMGFIAQDFQKVFPDLVKMDEDSLLSIDYIGLIPVLVEAIKIQQDKIDNLEKQIIKGNLKNGTIQSSTNPDNVERLENALLFQNTPNPFSDKTEIKFFLPDNIKVAQLNIYNMQGLQIKSYSLSQRGSSSIIVNGYELQAGMYMYSLIADSKEIDTKRMILTD
ncbi:MAG: T9SS type A sorting domain-containing protein, partial [Bacteroidales bacterium]|nr:T9SS type A sorting domain-containing protein [Bacteroidales bacterium]